MEETEISKPTLEDVMLALQKTFSRVSQATALIKNDSQKSDAACAMVVGQVGFQISLPATLGSTKDKLLLDPEGPIKLNLQGFVQSDVRATIAENIPDVEAEK